MNINTHAIRFKPVMLLRTALSTMIFVCGLFISGIADGATPMAPQKSGKGNSGNAKSSNGNAKGSNGNAKSSSGGRQGSSGIQHQKHSSPARSNQGGQAHSSSSPRAPGQTSFSNSGHNHNSIPSHQSHNSSYRSHPSNYRSSGSYLSLSPSGLSFGFGNVGGVSQYYRPTYGYSTYGYNSVPTGYYDRLGYDSYGGYYSGNAYPYGAPSYGSIPSSSGYPLSYDSTTNPGLTPIESTATSQLLYDGSNSPSTANLNQPLVDQVPTNEAARAVQRRSEQAFKRGAYAESMELTRQALQLDSGNGLLMLFAAQASFAIGDYANATSYVDHATQIIPSEQWGFVAENFRGFYGRNDYVSQTDQLSQFIDQHPEDSQAVTIRGYQYGSLGYKDAATKDLQDAIKMDASNRLADRLLQVLNPVTPEDIQAPIPANIAPLKMPNRESDQSSNGKIIQLVPQFTDRELESAVPVEANRSILIDGPAK